MKVFISQPMEGKSNLDIYLERAEALKSIMPILKLRLKNDNEEIEILDTMFANKIRNDLMAHFTFALAELAKADVVVMMPNCNDSDICVLEHETAVRCGLPIYYL